jgi:uncharacterized protein (DUF1330 family)
MYSATAQRAARARRLSARRRKGFSPEPPLEDDGPVTAYWISVYREILDETKVAAYGALARPALQAAGGTFLASGHPEQTYEAGESTRVVIIEFESVDAARRAHDSEAYAAALAALDGGLVRDLRIVPGVG